LPTTQNPLGQGSREGKANNPAWVGNSLSKR